MVRILVGAMLLALVLAGPAAAQQHSPSAAIVALRDRFEAEFLAVEGTFSKSPTGLRRAAAATAKRVYGSDWDAVRAEAKRSLAALPTIDLALYARLEPARPFADKGAEAGQLGSVMKMNKWMFAAMRFWDAETVAHFAGSFAPMKPERGSVTSFGLKIALVPMRAWRGRLKGMEVLALRKARSLVVTPYSLTADGLILPDLTGIRVYPLQRQRGP